MLSVIETAFVKVLTPANDCASVETKPVDPVPAIGILNVCVDPKDDTLGKSPELPIEKN